ncbi:MAG: hypothetical protein OET44_00155 [Gammaproteobacteria bacterium]|nr:hypothetical protein [Gammaproteobacteria bacterium]
MNQTEYPDRKPAETRKTTLSSVLFKWMRFGQKIPSVLPWPPLCDFSGFSLDAWLQARPALTDAIEWNFWDLGPLLYVDWPEEKKAELAEAFWYGHQLTVADPAPNLLNLADADAPRTVLSPDDAWNLYRVTVGHVLAAEYAQSFPWSLLDYDYAHLIGLLNGRWMFSKVVGDGGYEVAQGGSVSLPSPPAAVYPFLTSNDLIGVTRLDTIVRITEWCRQNLSHYLSVDLGPGLHVIDYDYNWQYRGYPPVSRVIGRTPTTNPDPLYQDNCVVSRTAGCWGTTGFLISVLRLLNIPVHCQRLIGDQSAHATPWFLSEDLWYSHGDDPYNGNAFATPPYPADEFLIDRATFEAWFGDGVTPTDIQKNVGRQVGFNLVTAYWPDTTLREYCSFWEVGRTGHDNGVYESLTRYEPISDATWQAYRAQMEQKINGFGGCDQIPENHRFDEYCD